MTDNIKTNTDLTTEDKRQDWVAPTVSDLDMKKTESGPVLSVFEDPDYRPS